MDSHQMRTSCLAVLDRIRMMELMAMRLRTNVWQRVAILDIRLVDLDPRDVLGLLRLRNAMLRLDVADATMALLLRSLEHQRRIVATLMI